MRYRKLDPDGDYTLGTGADHYQDEPNAVLQAVRTRLRLWRGTWFLDRFEGVQWLGGVLGRTTQTAYDALIRQAIAETPGLLEIVEYTSNLDREARLLTVSAKVVTIYSRAPVVVPGAPVVAVPPVPTPPEPARLDIDFTLDLSTME